MNVIKEYFKVWWIPLVSYSLPIFIYIIGTFLKSDNLIDVALFIFYLNILGNIISAIIQIFIRKWYFIFPQLIISGFLFFYFLMIFTFSPPDYYGANKTIPENIKFEKPFEREITEKDLQKNDFKLAEISQPGIYNYCTNYKPKDLGTFFIKAFEITSNDRLSEARITNRSKVKVDNLNNGIYCGEFTIYEGSWGDKYGAKIELWYEPKIGKKYKIAEKKYIVEGWMR
jgi:hypothetical protein